MKALKSKRRLGRLKKSGIFFVIIMLGVLLAAWNTGTNLLYIIVGGLASFILISLFLPGRSMKKLSMRREAPSAVHRGEPFLVSVRLENHKLLLPAISLRLESASEADRAIGYLMRLPARRAAMLTVQVVFDRRGVYRLPPFDLVSSYPFGLIEQRRRFSDEREIVVYPRVRIVRTTVLDQAAGTRYLTRRPSADGDEFYGLREYVPGDDLRLIAWRASARFGKWIIRELARENSRYVTFALDTRYAPDMDNFEENFEEVIELVASLAITLLRRQYNVSIVTPQVDLEPGEGSGQEREVLELLARVESATLDAYPDFESVVRRLEGERAVLLYFSADSRQWGRRSGTALSAVDPREVLHA
ncbi:MAG: DUF58 domain-containing protein [Candidatus Hydrogenedentes bacterium]|nr:DUF58 domain-containing protein [Candidatus Hydrogenedentota bacterium]